MTSKFANWKCGDSYQLEKVLGHGSYGEVALAIHKDTGKKCAIKLMRDIFDIPVDAKRAYREIHILRHLKHTNIIALNEVISPLADENSKKRPIKDLADLYLVFDFVDTDLSKIFRSDQHMGTGHIKYILYQLCLGLKYLHSANVIHRDIKPANILISCTDCSLRIADFGLSRVVGRDEMSSRRVADTRNYSESKNRSYSEEKMDSVKSEHTLYSLQAETDKNKSNKHSGMLGPPDLLGPADAEAVERPNLRRQLTHHVITRWYRAPEVILSQNYDSLVDIWSIGCIFAELLGMQKENVPNFKDRRPIFPGESCGELSADDSSYDHTFHEGDQLSTILDVLGTPSDSEISNFPSSVVTIVKSFGKRNSIDFRRKYPATDEDGFSLLKNMLAFNPSKRLSIDEVLHHPFLSCEQSDRREREATCKEPMSADIEQVSEDPDNLFANIIREVNYYKLKKQSQNHK